MSKSNEALLSTTEQGAVARASSVLQRNIKLYGPMNSLTDNSSTCWNSEGSNGTEMEMQWIQVEFAAPARPTAVCVQFQPGFSAETCTVQFLSKKGTGRGVEWEPISKDEDVEWEDVHQLQRYELTMAPEEKCCAIRLVWEEDFADLYGRIIIYQMQVWGSEA
mmetsp:Transcript_36457/g.75864  ORF Transcript_36457/g.75864 Transcript_36457/m.75864 type:complete len:163 (-) Transcript_36457:455-943(-)